MSHPDQREQAARTNSVYLWEALQWLTAGISWSARFRADCGWCPWGLVCVALLWAWSGEMALTERFACALRLGNCVLKDTLSQPARSTSYQAFLKMLVRWTPQLVQQMMVALRKRMMEKLASLTSIAGYFVLAADGSRIDLPRTASHERAYSPKKTRNAIAATKNWPPSRRRSRRRPARRQPVRPKKRAIHPCG